MERRARHTDSIIVVSLLLLSIFGLCILLTIGASLFWQQLLFVIIGIFLCLFMTRVDPIVYRWFAPFGYVFSVLFLITTYLGPSIRGATRWISVAGLQLQPSELVKPILLLAFSFAITTYPPKKTVPIIIHTILFLIPFVLVFKQPDLGSGIVYVMFWLAMMVMGGLPLPLVFGGIVTFGGTLPLIWRILHDYQRSRILTFLNPMIDPKGAGYNALQAMIAVGSGQWFGRGLGLGTQSHLRFLPEYYTDFIFATLVEELGFVGGVMLLFLYGILLWRIIRPLLLGEITDRMATIFSIGLFTMLLVQIVVNSGMNMGVIPVTGITLPLLSAGGSSLLSIAASFGILWAIAIN